MESNLLDQEEEAEKQIHLPESIDGLNASHFPLFVTIKRLIYMLDASMDYSFFSRNSDGKIVGMESNVQWHNESKGVFMINQYFKMNIDYDNQIKKLGAKLMKLDEKVEVEDVSEDELGDLVVPEEEEEKEE